MVEYLTTEYFKLSWSKDITKINETQDVFNHRARMCTLAAQGKWTNDLENK